MSAVPDFTPLSEAQREQILDGLPRNVSAHSVMQAVLLLLETEVPVYVEVLQHGEERDGDGPVRLLALTPSRAIVIDAEIEHPPDLQPLLRVTSAFTRPLRNVIELRLLSGAAFATDHDIPRFGRWRLLFADGVGIEVPIAEQASEAALRVATEAISRHINTWNGG